MLDIIILAKGLRQQVLLSIQSDRLLNTKHSTPVQLLRTSTGKRCRLLNRSITTKFHCPIYHPKSLTDCCAILYPSKRCRLCQLMWMWFIRILAMPARVDASSFFFFFSIFHDLLKTQRLQLEPFYSGYAFLFFHCFAS